MIQVNLKLKLTKVIKTIQVKYNTFEKATFDEYLIASLALHSRDESAAEQYIDELTGGGSLNPHFKNLYREVKGFSDELLRKIMSGSMYPRLKIDNANRYEYYPQLNVSVFRKHAYVGDLQNYANLVQNVLFIDGKVMELNFKEGEPSTKPEPYSVMLDDDGNVKVRVCEKDFELSEDLFRDLIDNELDAIKEYKGQIRKQAKGNGWGILNNGVLKSMFSDRNYFYLDGDYYRIRNVDVKRTEVSRVSGLYIYREHQIPYTANAEICRTTLEILRKNKSISLLKSSILLQLLRSVDSETAKEFINFVTENYKLSHEMAELSLQMIKSGDKDGWTDKVLQTLLKFCGKQDITHIYAANSKLIYTDEQLDCVEKSLLTEEHTKQLENYYRNIAKMKATIRDVIGEVTTSGLRENAKKLKSDADTKKFSKLCNSLIGHEHDNLDEASYEETVRWHKEALELKELSIIIAKKLKQLTENL